MKTLGIDYGRKKCGIAYSEGELASPYLTVHTGELVVTLARISQELNIQKIIIGLPDGRLEKEIKDLSEKLRSAIACEVVFTEEDLTTHTAIDELKHTSKKRRREKEHEIAAVLILENYLREQKNI